MATSMAFWFRRQYSLAPTDPRFLDATIEDIETDYWAHHYAQNPTSEEVEDDDFDADEFVRDALKNPDDWEEIR
jgi:hypothetical protein